LRHACDLCGEKAFKKQSLSDTCAVRQCDENLDFIIEMLRFAQHDTISNFINLGVKGRLNRKSAALKDVSVDHGGFDIFVPEEFLNGADVVAVL